MFIDADGDGKTYVELQVNAKGATFDSYLPTYRQNQNDWDANMKAGVNIEGTLNKRDDEDKRWTVELAIPLGRRWAKREVKNVPPKVGTEWRVNFFRMDQPNGRPQSGTGWSAPMVGDFHALEQVRRARVRRRQGSRAECDGGAFRRDAGEEGRCDAVGRDRGAVGRQGGGDQAGAEEPGEDRVEAGVPSERSAVTRRRPAMDELFDILIHPARWATDASTLRDSTRIYLALLIFGVTVLLAFAAGWLSARWAHRRTGQESSERNERTILRLRRSFIALVIAIGSYLAVEMAPLPERIDGWLSGITFIFGAVICARLVIDLVALLLTSSVMHVSGSERARLEREYVPLAEEGERRWRSRSSSSSSSPSTSART